MQMQANQRLSGPRLSFDLSPPGGVVPPAFQPTLFCSGRTLSCGHLAAQRRRWWKNSPGADGNNLSSLHRIGKIRKGCSRAGANGLGQINPICPIDNCLEKLNAMLLILLEAQVLDGLAAKKLNVIEDFGKNIFRHYFWSWSNTRTSEKMVLMCDYGVWRSISTNS